MEEWRIEETSTYIDVKKIVYIKVSKYGERYEAKISFNKDYSFHYQFPTKELAERFASNLKTLVNYGEEAFVRMFNVTDEYNELIIEYNKEINKKEDKVYYDSTNI